jgi:RNA-binding protein
MPPSPPKLSGAALRQLRALGHALAPVVAIGKEGLTDSLVQAADSAIATHELVKVKIHREAPVDRHEAGIELAARTGSVLAQVIGRTLLLYRRHAKKPKIALSSASSIVGGSRSGVRPGSGKGNPKGNAASAASKGAKSGKRRPYGEAVESGVGRDGDPEESP